MKSYLQPVLYTCASLSAEHKGPLDLMYILSALCPLTCCSLLCGYAMSHESILYLNRDPSPCLISASAKHSRVDSAALSRGCNNNNNKKTLKKTQWLSHEWKTGEQGDTAVKTRHPDWKKVWADVNIFQEAWLFFFSHWDLRNVWGFFLVTWGRCTEQTPMSQIVPRQKACNQQIHWRQKRWFNPLMLEGM